MKKIRGTVVLETLEEIADPKHTALLMKRVLANPGNLKIQREVRSEVTELCRRFPIP